MNVFLFQEFVQCANKIRLSAQKNLEGFNLKFIGFSREVCGAFSCMCNNVLRKILICIKHQRANANYGFIGWQKMLFLIYPCDKIYKAQ